MSASKTASAVLGGWPQLPLPGHDWRCWCSRGVLYLGYKYVASFMTFTSPHSPHSFTDSLFHMTLIMSRHKGQNREHLTLATHLQVLKALYLQSIFFKLILLFLSTQTFRLVFHFPTGEELNLVIGSTTSLWAHLTVQQKIGGS